MARSENRKSVDLPRPLYAELRAQAQQEQRPLTSVVVELLKSGRRQTVQQAQGVPTTGGVSCR